MAVYGVCVWKGNWKQERGGNVEEKVRRERERYVLYVKRMGVEEKILQLNMYRYYVNNMICPRHEKYYLWHIHQVFDLSRIAHQI